MYNNTILLGKILIASTVLLLSSCDLINEPAESIDIGVSDSELAFSYDDKQTRLVRISNYREFWHAAGYYGENEVPVEEQWIILGENGSTLSVGVAENTVGEERSAEVIVTSKYRNPARIKVIQGPAPVLSLVPEYLSFEWDDDREQSVTVRLANLSEWEFISESDWIQVKKSADLPVSADDGAVTESVLISVRRNDTGSDRSSAVVFKAQGIKDVTLPVTQKTALTETSGVSENSCSGAVML